MDIKESSRIAGVGAYLPEAVVTSEQLMHRIDCARFGAAENYISESIGIKERRIADPQIMPSDMATFAAESAIAEARIAANDLDMIIYGGIEGDDQEPATANKVQSKLGCDDAICLDVANACNGFMTGLSVADAFIKLGRASNILVCCGEKSSRIMEAFIKKIQSTNNEEDYKRWLGSLTLGDAGGAVVVQASKTEGWQYMKFKSVGQFADLCHYNWSNESIDGQILMGKISRHLVRLHAKMLKPTYKALDWTPSMVDRLYCHQAGERPHKLLVKIAGVPPDSAPSTYERYGNLGSATIPVNLALYPPKRGSKLLFLGSGSGLSICQAGMIY